MRVIPFPITTYSRTLAATSLVEPQVIAPNLGPLQGLYMTLTVAIAGGTDTQTSNSIDNIISAFQCQDDAGEVLLDIHGYPDISVLNDILQPRGVRTAAPAISTSGAGAGTATWSFFLPFTVMAKGMPGKINLTWAAGSALQNGGLASAGTVTVLLRVTGAYSTATDQPSLRVKSINVPHGSGDNNVQAFLPNGEQVEALAFVLAADYAGNTDNNLGYETLTAGGAFLVDQEVAGEFIQQDVMLMQSGHQGGEYINRIPVFVVDSRTTLRINLVNDDTIILYTISTTPQGRAQ